MKQDLATKRMEILEEAQGAVGGSRQQDYGSPEDSFDTIAAFWTTWLKSRGKLAEGTAVTGADVAGMMALLKLARLSNDPKHRDSQVDLAGYGATMATARDGEEPEDEEGFDYVPASRKEAARWLVKWGHNPKGKPPRGWCRTRSPNMQDPWLEGYPPGCNVAPLRMDEALLLVKD